MHAKGNQAASACLITVANPNACMHAEGTEGPLMHASKIKEANHRLGFFFFFGEPVILVSEIPPLAPKKIE